ncbi:hypothetical protein PPSIR1_21589 [Plesiocystis pacifica SIR-1]|uniref:Uncharacterized protein n=1 Tax=Plesiocystis pacifica SIR-1 TaxID=391625 RepID=A6FXG5_9BACT|nr:hypothetical protein PPSIR1_21589 [Plesiocystis pacifica SIR-1]
MTCCPESASLAGEVDSGALERRSP